MLAAESKAGESLAQIDAEQRKLSPAPEPVVLAPWPVGMADPAPAVQSDDLRRQRVEQLRDEFAKAVGDTEVVTPDGRDYQQRYLEEMVVFDQQFIALYGYSAYSSQQAWVIQHTSR